MSILCGTDFFGGTRNALRVAATLAGRRGEPLLLVHAIDTSSSPDGDSALDVRTRAAAARHLHTEAQAARELGAPAVTEHIADGAPEEVLVSTSASRLVDLIVLGALGRPGGPSRSLGRTTERVVESAGSPVLVVRDAAPIEAWLRGERALKIVVGDDLTSTSQMALRWTAGLRGLGRCDIVACHVYGLLAEKSRLGIPGALHARIPELEQANLGALRRHAGPILGRDGVRYRVEATLGRPAEPLLAIAAEEAADLLVVGTKQRTGLGRVWHGSSSHVVLSKSPSSVACVPAQDLPAQQPAIVPTLRRVLVTTDFSSVANQAVAYAYAVVANGGTVHLLHVEERHQARGQGTGAAATADAQLRRLIPDGIPGKTVETKLEVVREADVSAAISAAAERLDVDIVCMGTHGRSGLAQVALGSVAQWVTERCRRQVLLVPPRCEEP